MERTGILLFAFGTNLKIRSNQVLRKEVLRCCDANEVSTIFSQDAIMMDSYYGKHRVICFDQPNPNKHPPTLRIARWAIPLIASEFRYDSLIVIAADPHIDRCMRDSNYVLHNSRITRYTNMKIKSWPTSEKYTDQDWFCADSQQPRTRTRQAWEKRESVLMVMPMWIYSRLAG